MSVGLFVKGAASFRTFRIRVASRIAGLILCGALADAALSAATKEAGDGCGLIRSENQKQGTSDWQLTYVRLDKAGPAGFRSPGIEGYCSRQSVGAGEPIEFFVSMEPAGKLTLEIFRMG